MSNTEFILPKFGYPKILKAFVPENIFDIHAHIYNISEHGLEDQEHLKTGPNEVGIDSWRENSNTILKNKPKQGLFMPLIVPENKINIANDFLLKQLEVTNKVNKDKSKGLILISPNSDKEEVEKYLQNPDIVGFKPYHIYSNSKPTYNSSIDQYIPEWVFETANKAGYVIMLHLVKPLALADPDNQRIIIDKCSKYPNMKLVLAHAARGFHSRNTTEGICSLRGLENIWFDTSGICEAEAIYSIMEQFGPSKIMWGSDFPVSHIVGKCVTIGDGFFWLRNSETNLKEINAPFNPFPVGVESLLALKTACENFGLTSKDIENIFYNNARNLLKMGQVAKFDIQELYKHAKTIIPGGVQLLSKRPEMFSPGQWPAYFSEARGCEVWDTDGRHYYDMSLSGISSCLLGYRDPDVTNAVKRRINLGSMSTLNAPEEVELAEKLIEIHPWAEQVRFARTGGEIVSVAVRIARSTTDRSVVAISGYHGWHDWYLAANLGDEDALRGHLLPGLEPLGVPRELRNTTVSFKHGSIKEFQKVLDKHGDKLAAVVMEPCRHTDPVDGFLEYVRSETKKRGIILIFDEITIGWRRIYGGSHLRLGINPDMAVFAKSLGNGHPVASVLGTSMAMSGAHSSFISSTYWTESVGPAAALAVLDKMSKIDVVAHVDRIGTALMELWKKYGAKYSLPIIVPDCYTCLPRFKFEHELSNELKTLYTQLMLDRGFLATTSASPTLAHTEKILTEFEKALEGVFMSIAHIIKNDNILESLKGPAAHTGFSRLI